MTETAKKHSLFKSGAGVTLDLINEFVWAFILTLSFLAFIFILVIPVAYGARPTVVLTQSMQPSIDPGDVIMIKQGVSPNELRIGDIIEVFPEKNNPDTYTHRLTGMTLTGDSKDQYSFITQGDNNNAPDDPIVYPQIKGKVIDFPVTGKAYVLPKIGYIKAYPGVALGVLAGIIILASLSTWYEKRRARDEEQEEAAEDLSRMEMLEREIAALKASQAEPAETVAKPAEISETVETGSDNSLNEETPESDEKQSLDTEGSTEDTNKEV